MLDPKLDTLLLVAEKKKRTQLASTVFKKPVLKDEVQILHDIMKK